MSSSSGIQLTGVDDEEQQVLHGQHKSDLGVTDPTYEKHEARNGVFKIKKDVVRALFFEFLCTFLFIYITTTTIISSASVVAAESGAAAFGKSFDEQRRASHYYQFSVQDVN
jgi:hypothetical protein